MPNPVGASALLPQYQGTYYDIQRRQALAQAMMENSLRSQAPTGTVGSGGDQNYQVMPRMSPIAGLSQLAQAYMAAKMQGQVGQDLNSAGQQQWGSLLGMMGGGQPPPQAQPQPQGGAGMQSPQPDGAPADAGGAGNAAMGGSAPLPPANAGMVPTNGPVGGAGSAASGMSAPMAGGGMNPLGMNPGFAALSYMTDPGKFMETQAQAYKPAEIIAQLRAAGIDPQSALGKQLAQTALSNSLAPPMESLRPGGYAMNRATGEIQQMPQVPEGFTAVRGANGWQIVPVQGGAEAIAGTSRAKASGPAQFSFKEVWDQNANGGRGGMVYQPSTNVSAAAGGGAPAPMRNNNPGAMMPGGKLAQYPDMQTGLNALDSNLQSYGKQGINTIAGVIGRWAPPNENNTQAYIQDVSQRLGIPPNQKIDLSNPMHRQALSTAIALHENGPQGVFGGAQSAGASPGGPMASAPPLGQTANVDESQKAGAEAMQVSYMGKKDGGGGLQASRAGGASALQDIDHMISLGAQKSPLVAGPVASGIAQIFSPNAAEYEKSRDNLVTQLSGQLGMNTDAARGMVYGSIPAYGAPKQAIQNGLTNLRNQVQARMLKSDLLTPHFNSGDSNTYNRLENEFDRNINPQLAGMISMPPGPQRAQALKQAAANPAQRARLEWAAQNGVLK